MENPRTSRQHTWSLYTSVQFSLPLFLSSHLVTHEQYLHVVQSVGHLLLDLDHPHAVLESSGGRAD